MIKKKLLSGLLCASFLFSSAAAAKVTFSDVENDPTVSWAKPYINEMAELGYIKGYEDESLNEESGKREMYTLNGTELTLESKISFDLVYNNGNIPTEGVWLQPDFAPEGEVLPELSTVTDNDQEIPMEVYALRMDNLVILHDIRDAE